MYGVEFSGEDSGKKLSTLNLSGLDISKTPNIKLPSSDNPPKECQPGDTLACFTWLQETQILLVKNSLNKARSV